MPKRWRMQLFVAAMMASLSEEVTAKDRKIADLREHVADREGRAAGFQYQHIGDGHICEF
jgi:hypothetical protein